jgi:cytochrome c oxidase subunit III
MKLATNSGLLAHQFDDLEQQRDTELLSMWLFLATELLIFGGLFTGYAAYRYAYPNDFEAASRHLNVLIGAINTIVLLTSSLTMALAVYATHQNRQKMLVGCLALTALLGTVFMILKGFEYYIDYREDLVPWTSHFRAEEWTDPGKVALFLLFYYVMTGLHAVHLTVGIALMLWLTIQARRGRYSPEHYIPMEVVGLYWHFVDIVWIFLLPLLYLIGTHSPEDLHF